MDISAAQLSNTGDEIIIVDPNWPWLVRVRITGSMLESVTVQSRDGEPITSRVLSQLPLQQITHVAVSAIAGEGEAQLRMLARPRPKGQRSWAQDHYRRVARVSRWARSTGRPGGAAQAVAEFWDVHLRTARRWLAQARGQGLV